MESRKSLSKSASLIILGLASSLALPPMARAEELSTTGRAAVAAGFGLATYGTARFALDDFINSHEFTAQDRKFFLESESFANKAWKQSTSTVTDAINDIHSGKIGAVRVQVAGMSTADALGLMQYQHIEAAIEIIREINLPPATRHTISTILEAFYEEPIPPNVRDGIVREAIKSEGLDARYASKVAEYIDHRSAAVLLEHRNVNANFSQAMRDRKVVLTSDTMMVFTGTEAETPQKILTVIGDRKIKSVETIATSEYRIVLQNLQRAREIVPSTKEFRTNKKFGTYGLALSALILGGFTTIQLVDLFQAPAAKWTPPQIDVKK